MREYTDEELMESELAKQIPDFDAQQEAQTTQQAPAAVEEAPAEKPQTAATEYLGTSLTHKPGSRMKTEDVEKDKNLAKDKGLSRLGERIGEHREIRDGWMEIDRRLLGERDMFYPSEWRFKVRPATVEAIRNWSTIDDENPNSVDDVFNEILKSCLSIETPSGLVPWGNINSWDRFFFLLLIREYTFVTGDSKLEYTEECQECGNDVPFTLSSQTLMYDMPDPEVLRYFSAEDRDWMIDPAEYGIEGEEPVTLYLPTLEKDANIKAYLIDKLQQNRNARVDQVFIRFLPWIAPKISKDLTIAKRQIRECETKFNSWDTEMFSFMDEVLKNIIVSPATKLTTTCPVCGEEMTSPIRFPNGVRSLFSIQSGHKKFGKK